MKFYKIILFNGTVEFVEAISHKSALIQAKLDGINRWMVTSISIALQVPAACIERRIDKFCGIDDNVLFINPAASPEYHDSYKAMGLS